MMIGSSFVNIVFLAKNMKFNTKVLLFDLVANVSLYIYAICIEKERELYIVLSI
jgi:hypothetical protein